MRPGHATLHGRLASLGLLVLLAGGLAAAPRGDRRRAARPARRPRLRPRVAGVTRGSESARPVCAAEAVRRGCGGGRWSSTSTVVAGKPVTRAGSVTRRGSSRGRATSSRASTTASLRRAEARRPGPGEVPGPPSRRGRGARLAQAQRAPLRRRRRSTGPDRPLRGRPPGFAGRRGSELREGIRRARPHRARRGLARHGRVRRRGEGRPSSQPPPPALLERVRHGRRRRPRSRAGRARRRSASRAEAIRRSCSSRSGARGAWPRTPRCCARWGDRRSDSLIAVPTRARGHQPDAGQPARHDGRDRGGHGIRPRRRRAAAACMTCASGC